MSTSLPIENKKGNQRNVVYLIYIYNSIAKIIQYKIFEYFVILLKKHTHMILEVYIVGNIQPLF